MASLELDDNETEVLDGLEEHHDDDIVESPTSSSNPASSKKALKRKKDSSTLRKAPQAPKRFKSSYICFFMAKQPEIKSELGEKATVTEISKRSAQMWRSLPGDERAHWDEVAAKDKQRYLVEKASYTGPWQVPWKRAKKDPSAPKRPMSAFLYYSQGKRREIKEANPSLKNTEVSRLLGEMWRAAPIEEKTPFIEKEKGEREKYKVRIADWRKEDSAKQEQERKDQEQQQAAWSNMYHVGGEQQPQQHPYPPAPYSDPNHAYGQPPPPGPGYGYGYPYPYPANPYQYPTNGKQPVILGPSGTPRYNPPMAYGGPPPPHQQQPHAPPPHHYGSPPQQQQGYDQGHPPAHAHYDFPPEQQGGAEHPPQQQAPPPQYHHQQQQHQHQSSPPQYHQQQQQD